MLAMNQFIIHLFIVLIALISTSQAAQKTFVFCAEGSPSTFNPQNATDGASFNASSRAVYNRLVEFKNGSTEIVPGLAEKWTISKDGKTYKFFLRKNVQFHSSSEFTPTRSFNADDVIYSFDVQKEPKHQFRQKDDYEYFASMEMDKTIKEIKKIDDYTIEFILSRNEAPFLANLAMDFASILSKEYTEFAMKKSDLTLINTHPVGTGPFVFKSYQKDTTIRYEANKNYFRGKPKIDQLIFAITPDTSVRTQKLKVGECHLVSEPSPSDLETLMKTPKIKVLEKEGMNIGYLTFNTTKKPFDNLLVRKAITLALNRQSYVQAIYLNRAVVATNPMPPTILGYNDKIVPWKYDIQQAKKLLAEAGYPQGFEMEIWTLPVSRPYNPNGKKMGELMQADLDKVGIKVKLATFDWPTYLDKVKRGEHQAAQFGWTGDNGDPDNFLQVLLSCAAVEGGANSARWCNKEYDKLVTEAKVLTNKNERAKLYKKAQVIFHNEMPWVTLVHSKVYRAMSARVTGYSINPFGGEIFESVDLN
jgi:dipeptide transport system substrate-binding protein